MSKTKHNFLTTLRHLKPWYFLIIAVVSGLIGVSALRQNNLKMIDLRNAVIKADKDDGNVEAALRNLREFVYSHMNTNLSSGSNAIKPPIQLKYRYDRLIAAEKKRVDEFNTKLYADAQAACERQRLQGGSRVCEDYIKTQEAKVQSVPENLYKFDFVSPTWSPDLAGFSLLICVLSTIFFIASYGLERWVRAELN